MKPLGSCQSWKGRFEISILSSTPMRPGAAVFLSNLLHKGSVPAGQGYDLIDGGGAIVKMQQEKQHYRK